VRIIRDYLLELKAQGITILLTSHDMDEVDELCDRIGFINHGQLIVLEEKYILKSRYGSPHLKVSLREDGKVTEELLNPDTAGLKRLAGMYRAGNVVSVRSTEAGLAEIFRELSNTAPLEYEK
jgi:ABC-type multidrug transport system ATPase subunit